MYKSGRWLTVTGDHVPGTPTSIESRPEAVLAVHTQAIQTIREHKALVTAARRPEYSKAVPAVTVERTGSNGPGDDYNERGPEPTPMLERHGWTVRGEHGDEIRYTRPGKETRVGLSAQWNRKKRVFYNFSGNSPVFNVEGYSLYQMYTLLEHGGDASAATKALAAAGYGESLYKFDVGHQVHAQADDGAILASGEIVSRRHRRDNGQWVNLYRIGDDRVEYSEPMLSAGLRDLTPRVEPTPEAECTPPAEREATTATAGTPEALLTAVKTAEGLTQAQAVERLARALVGESAAVVNHYADILANENITTKTAFLQSVRDIRKASAEQAKVERRKAARTFSKERKLTSHVYHQLFESWGYDVRLNLCNDDVEVNGAILTDQVESDLRQRVRDHAIIEDKEASMGAVEDSIRTLAAKHSYHPVKDYFDGLKWDGQDHLDTLLSHFQSDGFLDRWLDTWLPGAVARVYAGWQNPMLVLDGAQGIGKSFLAQWLCSPLPKMFVESPICPEYKDHRLRLIQSFIWEVQELGATTRKADQDALKAFITLGTVRERKAYGRRDIQKPVICSFIGTTNPDAGFLTDLTGNRRYLVTTLTEIDWNYSAVVDVDQLWAQAVSVYQTGDNWKLTDADREAREEQNARYMVSDPVEVFLTQAYEYTGNQNDFVSTVGILNHLQTMHKVNSTRAVTMRVSSVLKSWGAQKKRPTVDGGRVWGYYGVKSTA